MNTWAIANQKGGVGKTAVTLGLASALSSKDIRDGDETRKARALVIDFDPQASATKIIDPELQLDEQEQGVTMTRLMFLEGVFPISEVAVPTSWGFDLAPSDIRLARREQSRDIGIENRLRQILEIEPHGYDIVLIDCPPSLGVLTVNALSAADYVLIVTQPGFAAMRGLADLLLGEEVQEMGRNSHRPSTIESVRDTFNPRLSVAGFIVNMADQTRDSAEHMQELRSRFSDLVWEPVIPNRVAMKESYTRGVPVADLPGSVGGQRMLKMALDDLAVRMLRHQNLDVVWNDSALDRAVHHLSGDRADAAPAAEEAHEEAVEAVAGGDL